MKNVKGFKFMRIKTFRRYLISYFCIVLILLSALSMIMLHHISLNMQEEEIRIAESKLNIILNDMEKQMDSMRRMAVEIATLQEFRLDILEVDKYKEIQLLEQLERYKQKVGISDDYFIKYDTRDVLFKASGKISRMDVYFSGLFGNEDYSELIILLEKMCREPVDYYTFYTQKDAVVFLYSLKEYAYSKIGLNSVLCFVVTERGIKERFETLVGDMKGQFALYYKDCCLFDDVREQGDTTLKVESKNGDLIIRFCLDKTEVFMWENVFSVKEQVVLLFVILVIIFMGFIMAYLNYLPMRKIVDKYKEVTETSLIADWRSIDAMIESILRGNEKNNKLLQEQYQLLKEQTIRNIALGGYSDRMQKYLTLLNIRLSGEIFGIIKCVFPDVDQTSIYEKIVFDVEALSGEGESLYMYWDKEPRVFVIAEEEYQLEEVRELLYALFDSLEINGYTELVNVSRDLTKIHQGNVKMDVRLKEQKEENAEKESGIKRKSNTVALKAVEYIREHCTDYDLTLELIADKFQITPTYLCRIIKQNTGMSYKEFLTGLRIEEARKMILEQDICVADVSQKVGYNNVSYFIKLFQKYTGTTPAKYREENRQENLI